MIGGFSFIFGGCASHTSSTIHECVFSGNAATTGSGLFVHFHNSSQNNSVTVSSLYFTDNVCPGIRAKSHHAKREKHGGAVNIVFDDNSLNNAVTIEESNFINNTALSGGDLFILFLDSSHGNSIQIVASNFSNNGQGGNPPKQGGGLSVFLMDSSYSNTVSVNGTCFTRNRAMRGGGLSVLLMNSSYSNNISINGTCFTENRAMRGAEIHAQFQNLSEYNNLLVIWSSFIHNSRVSFINNSAVLNGGAISYFTTDRHNFASFRNCFIEYQYFGQTTNINERDIIFLFDGNTAISGNSIYATTVEHCRRHLNCTTDPVHLFNCIGKFIFEKGESTYHQLASAGVKFRVNSSNPFPLLVTPGKSFEIPIIMLDEFGHPAQSLYNLHLSDPTNSFISRHTLFS